MANEMKHGTVGTELTQAEWEGIGTHVLDSQATGDVIYAASSSQLRRLAAGTDTHVLTMTSGIPAWSVTTGITTVGALGSGSITSGFGNIDVGSSSIAAGSFDASDGNISNVGDISLDSISADATSIELKADVSITGTTPVLTIGDAGTEDAALVFDGNAVDYHFGLDDTEDGVVLGKGTALGTTPLQYWDYGDADSQLISFGTTPSGSIAFKIGMTHASTGTNGTLHNFNSTTTLTPGGAGSWNGVLVENTYTIASDTVANIYNCRVKAPTINNSGTISGDTAVLYVQDASSTTVSGTNYALLVGGGVTRLAGGARIGSNSSNNLIDDASTGSGSTTLYVGNQSITTSSDERLKRSIEDTKVDALETLSKLRIVDFDWDDPTDISPNNKAARGRWTGMLAQETVEVVPHIINAPRDDQGEIAYDSEDVWMVDYQHLVPMLVKAIQEIDDKLAVM